MDQAFGLPCFAQGVNCKFFHDPTIVPENEDISLNQRPSFRSLQHS